MSAPLPAATSAAAAAKRAREEDRAAGLFPPGDFIRVTRSIAPYGNPSKAARKSRSRSPGSAGEKAPLLHGQRGEEGGEDKMRATSSSSSSQTTSLYTSNVTSSAASTLSSLAVQPTTAAASREDSGEDEEALRGATVPNSFKSGLSSRQISAKIGKTSNLEQLCELLESGGDFSTFDMANLSTALNRLGKRASEARALSNPSLPESMGPIFTKLVDRAIAVMGTITEAEMSSVFHSVATSGFFDSNLRETARKLYVSLTKEFKLRSSLDGFEPQHLSNICWAMAKVAFRDAELFGRISRRCDEAMLGLFSAQELAIVAWAFATAQVFGDDDWFSRLARACLKTMSQMTPQNLGNLSWAYATLHVVDAQLLRGISAEVMQRDFNSFHGGHFSQIVWSFATLDFKDEALFDKLSKHWIDQDCLKSFASMQLSSVCWAFATLRLAKADLFANIASEMLRRGLDEFLPQQLAMTMWSFATLKTCSSPLFDAVVKACSKKGLTDFPLHSITVISWSFSSLGLYRADFLRQLGTDLAKLDQLKENARCLGHLALSLATIGYVNLAVYSKLAAQCARFNLAAMSDGDLGNLSWAFACTDALHDRAVLELLNSNKAGDRSPRANDRDAPLIARQFLDCAAAWKQSGQGSLPPVLELFLTTPWSDVYRTSSTLMAGHFAQLRSDLEASGYVCEVNVVTPDYVWLDLTAQSATGSNDKVAVELCGPEFFLEDGLTPNGRLKFRQRLLDKAGIKFKVIRLLEWQAQHDKRAFADLELKMLGASASG